MRSIAVFLDLTSVVALSRTASSLSKLSLTNYSAMEILSRSALPYSDVVAVLQHANRMYSSLSTAITLAEAVHLLVDTAYAPCDDDIPLLRSALECPSGHHARYTFPLDWAFSNEESIVVAASLLKARVLRRNGKVGAANRVLRKLGAKRALCHHCRPMSEDITTIAWASIISHGDAERLSKCVHRHKLPPVTRAVQGYRYQETMYKTAALAAMSSTTPVPPSNTNGMSSAPARPRPSLKRPRTALIEATSDHWQPKSKRKKRGIGIVEYGDEPPPPPHNLEALATALEGVSTVVLVDLDQFQVLSCVKDGSLTAAAEQGLLIWAVAGPDIKLKSTRSQTIEELVRKQRLWFSRTNSTEKDAADSVILFTVGWLAQLFSTGSSNKTLAIISDDHIFRPVVQCAKTLSGGRLKVSLVNRNPQAINRFFDNIIKAPSQE